MSLTREIVDVQRLVCNGGCVHNYKCLIIAIFEFCFFNFNDGWFFIFSDCIFRD